MPEHDKHGMPDIRKALDLIAPDESAKDRMYLEIMRRAAVQETGTKKKPWYLRWQTTASVCAAAMACVVVAAASLHSRIPVDNQGELSVVTPAATTASEKTTPSETTVVSAEKPVQTQTTAASVEQTAVTAETTAAVTEAVYVEQIPVQTAAVQPDQNQTTTVAAAETKPEQTTVAVQETIPAPTCASDIEMPMETDVTAAVTDDVPLRQNIYLYYELSYHDVNYSTQYVNISGRQLTYLGPGVTSGAGVEDTHTVLIYAIDGVDASQQLAVQYAGETAYYIFNAVIE